MPSDRIDTPHVVHAIDDDALHLNGPLWDRPGDASPWSKTPGADFPDERWTTTMDRFAISQSATGQVLAPNFTGGFMTPAEAVRFGYRLVEAAMRARGVESAGICPMCGRAT
jgi:hypothetical protein